MIKLAIIIVNWNTESLLRRCLKSIKEYGEEVPNEVYVVDNNSSDDSVLMVKKEFPWVKLKVNPENAGFAKANNQILKEVKNPFVFLLNSDTKIFKNTLKALMNIIQKDKKIAACGPKMLNPNGTLQKLGFYRRQPSVIQGLMFYTDLNRLSFKIKFLVNRFWESNIETKKLIEVDQIPGACIFAKTDIIKKIGFFDEDFPIWFEDVDLCFRLRKAGYKLIYVPDSKIIHYGGASFNKWVDRASKETRFWKSMFIYFEKNTSFLTNLTMRTIVIIHLIFVVLTRALMQLFKPNLSRDHFIRLEIKIFKNLLNN